MSAESSSETLFFLKLGGSLITDKTQPHTPRRAVILRLARELADAWGERARFRLILGHGSGSFGHIPARKYGTRQGVRTQEEWDGFVEVWREASTLNRIVIDALAQAGLPALPFSPMAAILTEDGAIADWNLAPLRSALKAGLVPVVQGDAVFDRNLGGTILSTEQIFNYLARRLHPQKILLAGIEKGVWADFPVCARLVENITPNNFPEVNQTLGESTATDVTGGMSSKVSESLSLVQAIRGLEVYIFSGAEPGAVRNALGGHFRGTRIHSGLSASI
jgi:isopentenyl phosphate kinase